MRLVVTADDFGIGVETSRGILDLAARGAVTSTVLLANSPHAEASVKLWDRLGRPVELGWHPALTLDAPVLPAADVHSLVDDAGKFLPLGGFLKRLFRGQISAAEMTAELAAQYSRYVQFTGGPPPAVNMHHHLHVFPAVGAALRAVLLQNNVRPFVRRVVESPGALLRVPGARVKRLVLSRYGSRAAEYQAAAGLPGNDRLLGVTDPPCVKHARFFHRWLAAAAGGFVELTCHPGYYDASILGRDATPTDGQLERRARELELLRDPALIAELSRLRPGPAAAPGLRRAA